MARFAPSYDLPHAPEKDLLPYSVLADLGINPHFDPTDGQWVALFAWLEIRIFLEQIRHADNYVGEKITGL